jgi:predicted PurR-regulated permease PerM
MANLLDALARTLRRWMLGRIASMTVVGCVTSLGLWLIGIPLALSLGMLAGALGFIPNIGPIVSSVPALLIAAAFGLPHVGYVIALYLGVNLIDGYVLTPWIQKRSVATPAALVLVAQLVFGALWGILGLMLAVPLLACLLVIVRKLYVEDVLESSERRADTHGADGCALPIVDNRVKCARAASDADDKQLF